MASKAALGQVEGSLIERLDAAVEVVRAENSPDIAVVQREVKTTGTALGELRRHSGDLRDGLALVALASKAAQGQVEGALIDRLDAAVEVVRAESSRDITAVQSAFEELRPTALAVEGMSSLGRPQLKVLCRLERRVWLALVTLAAVVGGGDLELAIGWSW